LAETIAREGNLPLAKRILQRVAATQPHSTAGADAVARLAQLEMDTGQFSSAASMLEEYIRETTSAAGNGQIHLLLAKAYEGMGRLDDAAQVLRDVIAFFPDAPEIPKAHVALADILEKQGKRRDAVRLINQAALRFPQDADVMRSLGKQLALNGDLLGAADALESAEQAGARDPNLLLEAARYCRSAGDYKRAKALYERLIMNYPTEPQAFEGRIEIAKTFQEQGMYRKAFEALRDLANLSINKPQFIPVQFSLAELYEEMGFRSNAASTYAQIAGLSLDPRELARAIIGMLQNGALNEGLEAAKRVPIDVLPPADAYQFLKTFGNAMLKNDTSRGLTILEQAHSQYPDQRTGEDMLDLFNVYVLTDRLDNARTLFEEIARIAQTNPSELPVFQRAALIWGDYLYEKKDYAGAAEAYARVPPLSETSNDDQAWATFQRASALLHLKDYENAVPLLDEVAAGKNAWAPLAKQKAAFARLEQTLSAQRPNMTTDKAQEETG